MIAPLSDSKWLPEFFFYSLECKLFPLEIKSNAGLLYEIMEHYVLFEPLTTCGGFDIFDTAWSAIINQIDTSQVLHLKRDQHERTRISAVPSRPKSGMHDLLAL